MFSIKLEKFYNRSLIFSPTRGGVLIDWSVAHPKESVGALYCSGSQLPLQDKFKIFLLNKIKKKLGKFTPIYLIFTLITSLIPDFGKYSVIPSHLKKHTPRYAHILTVEVKRLKYLLLTEKIMFKFGYSLLRVRWTYCQTSY